MSFDRKPELEELRKKAAKLVHASNGGLSNSDLSKKLGVNTSSCQGMMKAAVNEGLVSIERRGSRVYYVVPNADDEF